MESNEKTESLIISTIEKLSKSQRQFIWLFADFASFVLGTIFAMVILFSVINPTLVQLSFFTIVSFCVFLLLGKLTMMRGHINRYLNLHDLNRIFLIGCLSSIIGSLLLQIFFQWHSLRLSLLAMIGSNVLLLAIRVLWQQIYTIASKNRAKQHGVKRKVVVLGAGDGGHYFMEAYRRNPGDIEVVGMLDSDPAKLNQIIAGVPVLGDRTLLPQLKEEGIEEIIIAIPSLESSEYEKILQACNCVGLKVLKMPKVEDVIQGIHVTTKELPKVNIADLLGRKEVKLDETLLRNEIENKTILVTGAGGSIGSEIVRQVSRFNPRRILLLGHGENSIYLIYHEMLKQQKMIEYVPVIADVQDKDRIVQILEDERPDIVYHAAAHKHVPLMEMNPVEAFKNNILGTYNVATAIDEVGIKKMVMISSDKAVNPPNIMGASKRVAELIVTGIAKNSQSIYCAVRFGNVLGSRGSVIPVFEKQIAEGGPITVTDFRMTRYFMTIPEASRLVIHAGAFAQSGEVFVLDMGEPVKIVDLAKKLILLSGYREDQIEIVESGIRPGEKLFEELLLNSEKGDRQIDGKIFVGNVARRPLSEIEEFISNLKEENQDNLKQMIVDFANWHEGEKFDV